MRDSSCEFFKVYLSQLSSKKLGLPPAFVRKLGGKIPQNCTIKDASGNVWPVKLEGDKVGLVVENGWQEFASNHSLVDGDFLVFEYDGNSRFGVKIYGINGLRKRKASNACASTSRVKKEMQQCAEAASSSLPVGPRSRVIRPNRNCHGHASGKLKQCRSLVVPFEAEEATSNFTSSNPYFKIVICPYHLAHNPSIPSKFVRDHIKPKMEYPKQRVKRLPETKLLTTDAGGEWDVTLIVYFSHGFHGKLSGGWRKFVDDNCLEEGDECFFELVNNNPVIMKVSVLKHTR